MVLYHSEYYECYRGIEKHSFTAHSSRPHRSRRYEPEYEYDEEEEPAERKSKHTHTTKCSLQKKNPANFAMLQNFWNKYSFCFQVLVFMTATHFSFFMFSL